jgi:hypothetical protein
MKQNLGGQKFKDDRDGNSYGTMGNNEEFGEGGGIRLPGLLRENIVYLGSFLGPREP